MTDEMQFQSSKPYFIEKWKTCTVEPRYKEVGYNKTLI